MKYIYYTCLLVMIGILFQSCEETIDLNLNEQGFASIVIDGSITNQEKAHTVNLFKTVSYFEEESAPVISGATVTIEEGENIIPLTETVPGTYQTAPNVKGEPGKTYTLRVKADGEEYTASSYMNEVTKIDSLGFTEFPDFGQEEELVFLTLYAQEPAGEDWYLFLSYLNGLPKNDTLDNSIFGEDTGVDGIYLNGIEITAETFAIGDTVKLEAYGITEEYNDFLIAISLESVWRGGIFDSPPANVPTNFSNGALGWFWAAGVTDYTTIITEITP